MIRVLKFGGSSIKDIDSIRAISQHIAKLIDEGIKPVVVVSALKGYTDELLRMAYSISSKPARRELDMLLSVGERISMSLLSIALNDIGIPSISFTGSQVGIITEDRFNSARIYEVKLYRIKDALKEGKVPIVAGFQGVSHNKEITTLGRGGSDLTAVALAVALKEEYPKTTCEMYKDVPGIYALDPKRFVSRRIDEISYDELLEMTSVGAKILHSRAVALSAKYNLEIYVRALYEEGGSIVKSIEFLEHPRVKAIVDTKAISLLAKVRRRMNLPQIIYHLSLEGRYPLVFHHYENEGYTYLYFVLKKEDLPYLERIIREYEVIERNIKEDLSLVSIVGYFVGNSPEVHSRILEISNELGIHVYATNTTDYRISVLIDEVHSERFMESLGRAFKLLE